MPPDSTASASSAASSLDMSRATRDTIARVRQMIPPMLEKFHKGAYLPAYLVPAVLGKV
jgi:ATP-dependent NAD(P)H-hydrate dehydratase